MRATGEQGGVTGSNGERGEATGSDGERGGTREIRESGGGSGKSLIERDATHESHSRSRDRLTVTDDEERVTWLTVTVTGVTVTTYHEGHRSETLNRVFKPLSNIIHFLTVGRRPRYTL